MQPDPIYALDNKRVLVAGGSGMVGSALIRRLRPENCEILAAASAAVDFRDSAATDAFFEKEKPQAVFVAAAKVGGIFANNSMPVEFLRDNLLIATNVISSAFKSGVTKLQFLGSSCIYPRDAEQPIQESSLLTGSLEPTNQWYALAKIAGVKLCEAYRGQYGADFISVMPTNIFGPGDNYHPDYSHVPAALIRRFHEAKCNGSRYATVWGTGKPRREFLYVDDLADACIFTMKHWSSAEILNIGVGEDMPISDFAKTVAEVVGYNGEIRFDASRPDGTPRKLLDVSRLRELGWTARTPLIKGLKKTYADFVKNFAGV
jgi:GDP-L-fucose synthase